MRLERGFTLVEILVAVAVSSLALATLYASYDIIQKQYTKIRDVSVLHQGGRNIMEMIKRDIRMAGFTYRDDTGKITYGAITEPITVSDSANMCCDAIEVTYDHQVPDQNPPVTPERIKIRYWVANHVGSAGARGRLFKQTDRLQPTALVGQPEVMADHIEDLQFVREKVQSSGSLQNLVKQSTDLAVATKLYDKNTGCANGCSNECETNGGFGQDLSVGENIDANFANEFQIGGIGMYAGEKSDTLGGEVWIKRGGSWAKVETIPNIGISKNQSVFQFSQNYTTDGVRFRMTSGSSSNVCIFEYEIHPGSSLSNLIDIFLALRTKEEYGTPKQYEKKSYRKGNYELKKTDGYRRGEYSTTVLVRNLAL